MNGEISHRRVLSTDFKSTLNPMRILSPDVKCVLNCMRVLTVETQRGSISHHNL